MVEPNIRSCSSTFREGKPLNIEIPVSCQVFERVGGLEEHQEEEDESQQTEAPFAFAEQMGRLGRSASHDHAHRAGPAPPGIAHRTVSAPPRLARLKSSDASSARRSASPDAQDDC